MKGIEIFFKTLIKDKVDHIFSPPNSFGPEVDSIFDKKFKKSVFTIKSLLKKCQKTIKKTTLGKK